MILTYDDAVKAARVFEDFFENTDSIADYLRQVKMERMSKLTPTLPGMGHEDDLFCDFTMSPMDMDFKIYDVEQSNFMRYVDKISSHVVTSSIPGKQFYWIVKETNTDTIVGILRMGSPVINSKPRNDWLGSPLDTTNADIMARFNNSAMMAFIVVPSQPFGYNYLGGKLLAGILCSHEIREKMNAKYGMNVCLMETTSLYGSTKSSSQYDGMKPFLRFKGITDSNFIPSINDEKFRNLNNWFTEMNGGVPIIDPEASSRKLKTQMKMISIIKNTLVNKDLTEYDRFCKVIEKAKGLTERKRFYMSTYGFTNVPDYLNLKTNELTKAPNYDRFHMSSIIDWWKNKAQHRFETLKSDGRLRTAIETWNTNAEDIDIIR